MTDYEILVPNSEFIFTGNSFFYNNYYNKHSECTVFINLLI